MDEKDRNEQYPEAAELNLDDILKEFGAEAEVETEVMAQAVEQMSIAREKPLTERLKELLAESEAAGDRVVPQTETADPAIEGQTIRMDPKEIREALLEAQQPNDDKTIRFEPVEDQPAPDMDGGTKRFNAIVTDKADEAPPQAPADQIPEGAEPFSASWEPEYEAPMGDYVPPEPLVFRPRSRLHDLKRKLIAGPEKRYYALAEQGVGRLQVAIFLSALVVVLSFVAIGLHSMGMVSENRMRLLVFGELFAMMLSALLGWHRMFDGLSDIFQGRFTPDTILALSFIVCMTDGVFCLREVRVPFCAAFCLEVTMSLWAEYQRRVTETGQMDTLRKAIRLNRVAKAPDCCEGRPGFYVTDGEVEDFMDTYTQRTTPQRILSWYCASAFVLSCAIAVAAGMAMGVSVGLQTWSAAILAAMPMTIYICNSRPMAVLERRFHKLGIVLCGWRGVKAMAGTAVVPLADTDLLPAGSMKINGVKFYSRRDPDQILAYATAIIECGGNALAPLFLHLLDSRNGRHYEADTYHSYEKAGIGGEVCGESVLVGTAQFLQDMGVDIPDGTRVSQAVYVAVDGELCGVFALAFGKLKGVSAGLGALCGDRGLTPVLTSDNFLLNEGFVRGKFSVNTRRMAFPTGEERVAVECWEPDAQNSVPCALTTQEGLASVGFAITGARALRIADNLGTVVHMIAGLLGMAMVLVLTLVSGDELLTPLNLLLYHLVWCIPGLLVSSWTRFV